MIPNTTFSTPTPPAGSAIDRGQMVSIDEKKSLIYFSSGMDRTGIENQTQLRVSQTNAAVRRQYGDLHIGYSRPASFSARRRSSECQHAAFFLENR